MRSSRCDEDSGFLDGGDTPARRGLYEAARFVVGAALHATERIMTEQAANAFVPIGGLHHAGRKHAAGFCVLNDIGVVIETLRSVYGIQRIGYVDIDVHHGDGVYYAYEEDPGFSSRTFTRTAAGNTPVPARSTNKAGARGAAPRSIFAFSPVTATPSS